MNRPPVRLATITQLRQSYRRREPVETLVVQKGKMGTFFLQFRFRSDGQDFAFESDGFPAGSPAEAAERAQHFQYGVLNGDLLEALAADASVSRAKAALESRIAAVLAAVPEGTPDVITNVEVPFAPDSLQPMLMFWEVTEPNAYRSRYEPELDPLLSAINACLARHDGSPPAHV